MTGVLLLALVIGCVGVGSTLGTVTGNLLKERKPEAIVLVVLIGPTRWRSLFAGVGPLV